MIFPRLDESALVLSIRARSRAKLIFCSFLAVNSIPKALILICFDYFQVCLSEYPLFSRFLHGLRVAAFPGRLIGRPCIRGHVSLPNLRAPLERFWRRSLIRRVSFPPFFFLRIGEGDFLILQAVPPFLLRIVRVTPCLLFSSCAVCLRRP